ncbi:MAG TPA: biotin--[acetyl-CoA-carboxylase] ligase [Candidatus Thermoplasmatota archaeon]|nr:biotin--[acetyl-CoA-carboxylase] ligase [Candidatus Thermoplasmatota archaeon]
MSREVVRLPRATSTMDEARRLARQGAADGTVVVAEEMTAGRGTHGRAWHAPKGGLYLSLVLRGVKDPHLLTLALGNAVADVLEVAGAEPRLKWVNDVWIGERKVAGILVEGESTGGNLDFLVAGIGINVNGDPTKFPADLRAVATTLEKELGCESCVPDVEALLLETVESWVEKVRDGHEAEIVAAFRTRDLLKGRKVTVEEAGPSPVKGTAAGIDERGRLVVETAKGKVALQTGRVLLPS